MRTADELRELQEKYNIGQDFSNVKISWMSSNITKIWGTCLPEWTTPGFLELIGEYEKITELSKKGLEIYFKQFDFNFTKNLFSYLSLERKISFFNKPNYLLTPAIRAIVNYHKARILPLLNLTSKDEGYFEMHPSPNGLDFYQGLFESKLVNLFDKAFLSKVEQCSDHWMDNQLRTCNDLMEIELESISVFVREIKKAN